jgi:hypothetical protein
VVLYEDLDASEGRLEVLLAFVRPLLADVIVVAVGVAD